MSREAALLSQAEYARHRKQSGLPGGSREAVRKAVDEGRIGLINGKIHPRLADEEWEKNTRARMSPQAAAAGAAQDLVDQAAGAGVAAPAPSAPPAPTAQPVPDTGYTAARARREQAEADLAEMAARKQRGELVSWEDVARAGFEVGRDIRDAGESAVARLAPELANITSAEECADLLRRHHRALFEVLVKSWREKIGKVPGGLVG